MMKVEPGARAKLPRIWGLTYDIRAEVSLSIQMGKKVNLVEQRRPPQRGQRPWIQQPSVALKTRPNPRASTYL